MPLISGRPASSCSQQLGQRRILLSIQYRVELEHGGSSGGAELSHPDAQGWIAGSGSVDLDPVHDGPVAVGGRALGTFAHLVHADEVRVGIEDEHPELRVHQEVFQDDAE